MSVCLHLNSKLLLRSYNFFSSLYELTSHQLLIILLQLPNEIQNLLPQTDWQNKNKKQKINNKIRSCEHFKKFT